LDGYLTNTLGINFQRDIDNFDFTMAGFFGSPISLNKNRMISRNDVPNNDGYVWITYDPDDLGGAERNYFEFPLLAETGGQKVALFDASETIATLPNGLQAYGLWNGAGLRQDEAPITVVTDNESPFNPIIVNGISCHRCHSKGLLIAADQIRDSALANASQFTADDLELIRTYFVSNGALSATFTSDIRVYSEALQKLSIGLNEADAVNYLVDNHRRDWTLADAAAFVLFTPDEFKACIRASNALQAQIGQLETGGTVGLVQFQASFPNIIQDCRLGQDDIDG
jgi:hypothetical protein